jgi:hypothetical protein
MGLEEFLVEGGRGGGRGGRGGGRRGGRGRGEVAGEMEEESNDGVAKEEDEVGMKEAGNESTKACEEGREVCGDIGEEEEGSGELGEAESSREGAHERGLKGRNGFLLH